MRRRSWLQIGIGSAILLGIGGGAIALVAPGLRNAQLTPESRTLVGAIAAAFLGPVLPTDTASRAAALQALLDRADTVVAALPAHAQRELSQLLALLDTAAGRRSLAGLDAAWREAGATRVEGALQSMRVSPWLLRRQAYQALHDLVGAAYFADDSAWAVLGYPGPAALP